MSVSAVTVSVTQVLIINQVFFFVCKVLNLEFTCLCLIRVFRNKRSRTMKMKCRLCELSLNQQKLGVLPGTCTHVLPETTATALPPPLGQLYHIAGFMPQLRDMMLAACLFRGEM